MQQPSACLSHCLLCNKFSAKANVDFERRDYDSPADISRRLNLVRRMAVSGSQGPRNIWSRM